MHCDWRRDRRGGGGNHTLGHGCSVRTRVDRRGEVSPLSLTDSRVFSGFLDINVNDASIASIAASACGAASAGTARLRRRDWYVLVRH
jgi:hypothetical protein